MIEDVRRRASRSGLEIVMVNVWEHQDARAEAQYFCDLYRVNGPVLIDEQSTYVDELGIRGVPTNVVVDEHGVVRAVGVSSPAALEAALADLGVELDA